VNFSVRVELIFLSFIGDLRICYFSLFFGLLAIYCIVALPLSCDFSFYPCPLFNALWIPCNSKYAFAWESLRQCAYLMV
jgi:hypothetical protein